MHDHPTAQAPAFARASLHVPQQAAPIDRALSAGVLDTAHRGVEADLFGLPVGDWLEAPGKYVWENYAKDWLNK